MVANLSSLTPCGALFDVLKRHGGINHKETAALILSERPLADGRSPLSRATDRTWVSRFIVHAPVGSLQPRYFRDFGVAAQHVMDRLRGPRASGLDNEDVLKMVCGEPGESMVRALLACHQDVRLYRNALVRLRDGEGYTKGERAEAAMVLFITAGCSANARYAVDYAMDYIRCMMGGRLGTPTSCPIAAELDELRSGKEALRALGLVRLIDGCISSDPYWVNPDSLGVEVGALVTGECDIADVDGDVSARHARIRCDAAVEHWLVCDLGSSNGTVLVSGETGKERALNAREEVEIRPGDELRLGATTTFVLVEGAADLAR